MLEPIVRSSSQSIRSSTLIGLREGPRSEALLADALRRAELGNEASAATVREGGVPLMRGLLAFDGGDAAETIRLLLPLRETAHRFGGSHAQRDLAELTQLAACAELRGERRLGRALVNERMLARGRTPMVEHWRTRLRS